MSRPFAWIAPPDRGSPNCPQSMALVCRAAEESSTGDISDRPGRSGGSTEASIPSSHYRLGAGADAELTQDCRDMIARGALADLEAQTDGGVVVTLRD